jgi:hypothetical protein
MFGLDKPLIVLLDLEVWHLIKSFFSLSFLYMY